MKPSPFLHLYPLVPICAVFIIGIVAGDSIVEMAQDEAPTTSDFLFRHISEWHNWAIITAMLIALLILLFKLSTARTLLLMLPVGSMGTTLMLLQHSRMEAEIAGDWTEYEAVIISAPVEREKNVRFDMRVLTGRLAGHSVRTFLQKDTITQRHNHLRVGTGLVVRSKIHKAENFPDSKFDYVRHLQVNGIVATTFVNNDCWYSDSVSLASLSLLERTKIMALRLRHNLLTIFAEAGLDGEAYALATAMTFGNRSQITRDTEDTYAITGVVHILSLSGLHLSIIYALLCFLSFGRRRRVLRELLLLLSIWTYVLISGAEPPLVRSALMITIYSLISISERNPLSVNVLAFTAVIMLAVNPLYLYDIGFQLSFLSIAGIMLLHKPLAGVLKKTVVEKNRLTRWIWHCVVMSCAAQLATIPLVALYFGRFPVYFLIANIIAIPLTTLILYLSVVVLLTSIVPSLSLFFASILTLLVDALNTSMTAIASLPCASIEGIETNPKQVFWIYFTLFFLCLLIRKVYKQLFPPRIKLIDE